MLRKGLNTGLTIVEQVFSDGIGAISIVGTTVRLDFVIISPVEKDSNGQPKVVHQQRVVMSLEGFANSAEKIRNALQALEKMRTRPAPAVAADDAPKSKPPFP